MEHVDAGARAIARLIANLGEEERSHIAVMERVRARYLKLDRDDEVAGQIAWMLRTLAERVDPAKPLGPGNRREARSVAVVGNSGAGKTTSLRRHFHRHPAFAGFGDPASDCPLITVDVPSPCTLKTLGRAILAATGYPLDRDLAEGIVWERVRWRLEQRGILVLHLDEMHNATETAGAVEIAKIRKTLKALTSNRRWPVATVVSGLPELVQFMEAVAVEVEDGGSPVAEADRETEVRRRFRFVRLQSLTLPGDVGLVADAVRDLAKAVDLRFPMPLREEVASRLIHAALYEFGTCLELGLDAIEVAIVEGAAVLTHKHFADAYAGRTGSAAPANPFLAPAWAEVDCTKVLRRTGGPEVAARPAPGRRRKRGRRS